MLKRNIRNLAVDTTAAETQFLRCELVAGLTFAKIALKAKHELKIERNRANARKAYDVLLHFIPTTILSRDEAKEINSRFAELKADLRGLGEDV